MLATSLIIGTALVAQYPDAIDHLRAGNVVPQVGLLLDRSCSMGWGHEATDCTWFADRYNGGNTRLDKRQQMQATLVGCRSATDGILDDWAAKVNFSLYEFGSGTKLRTPFGSNLDALEAGVLAIPATGATNMSLGLRDVGRYFDASFTNQTSLDCRPNFVLMLSDGNPNGGAATFDWECTDPRESRYVGANEPWRGADYMNAHPDLLCRVDGDQNIKTYTIGFGQPGDFSPANLQNIAASGDGEYFYASDAQQLSVAFESIIGSIVSRSAVFFAPVAIQTESMFSENYAYTASFKPIAGGPWRGNLEKHCIAPPIAASGAYDTSVDSCLFVSPDGHRLLTNPSAMDLWTGSTSLASDEGGAGELVFDRMETAPGAAPQAPYYDHRRILTWRPDGTDFVPVNPTSWTEEDAWTNGCEHHRLLNFLHGYTYDADCSTGAPVAAQKWSLGDPVNAPPVILKYGACHADDGTPNADACFVVVGMNDGMLHVFDAATGDERSAIVPSELWVPNETNTSLLREVQLQPTPSLTHRYYVDGGSRLFHIDSNLDGFIQPTEKAYLVFGLGRGGHAYYAIPVSDLNDGKLDASKNPFIPLVNEPGTSFEDLHQTWASPWLGQGKFGGSMANVAVFPSGHVPELDLVGLDGSASSGPTVDLSDRRTASCGDFARFNGLPASWCNANWFRRCRGTAAKPCYDGARIPLDVATAPLTFGDAEHTAGAVRLYFDRFDLHPSDVLRIEDASGNLVGAYTSQQLRRKWTPWVHDASVVIRLVTDGVDHRTRGYSVAKIQWAPTDAAPAGPSAPADFRLGVDHRPSIFVVDLDRFNGAQNRPFAGTTADDGLLLRITNDCAGHRLDACIDKNVEPDLRDMVCPISAEVSVYSEGGRATAMYWGDECGQIWKAWTPDGGERWRARRLINLNGGVVDVSKDRRKIFRKLDLVTTLCPGEPGIGIYFGTGNIQRPTAKDELMDPRATNGRDLVGVLWDSPGLPPNLTNHDLEDTTGIDHPSPASIVANGKRGWFVSLSRNERMLRDPFVFDGVAYFKTYEPTTAAEECGGGSGVDRIYAVDSCTSAATNDQNDDGRRAVEEREIWNGSTEIGGGLFFFTPKDRPVLVSHADITTQQDAALNARPRERPTLYFWRWE